MSSNALTEDQKRRMEENRKKALAKRGVVKVVPSAPTSEDILLKPTIQPTLDYTKKKVPKENEKASTGKAKKSILSDHDFRMTAKSNQRTLADGRKILTGSCGIAASNQFYVNAPYNDKLIAIFRSIKGGSFDVASKQWRFPIECHGEFLAKVDTLRPDICIAALPTYVLKVFRMTPPDTSKVDLSCIDPVLHRSLMPFQATGAKFGIARNGRVMICDDMGLGKTIQALAVAHYFYKDWPLLIVCPSSVKYTWRESIWQWIPSISPGSIMILEKNKDNSLIQSSEIVITSFDFFMRHCDSFQDFKAVIIDESHNLKNFKAARTKAIIPNLQRAKRAILLSGTPALSRPSELYNQIICVERNLFPSFNDFGLRYCDGKKNAWGWDFSGASNLEELQMILERTVMIRRLKNDILRQLPPKKREMKILDSTLLCLTSKNLIGSANSYKLKQKTSEAHASLLNFFTATCGAKVKAVLAYLREVLKEDKKFIVFAHHKEMLDAICDQFERIQAKAKKKKQ